MADPEPLVSSPSSRLLPSQGQVLYAQVVLIITSCITALIAGGISSLELAENIDPTGTGEKKVATYSLTFAYVSAATLLLSVIGEQIYVHILLGTAIYSTEQDLPTLGSRRWFWKIASCYWLCFVAGETCLIMSIKGLYHSDLGSTLFLSTALVDMLIMIFTICLHVAAIEIEPYILIHARINTLPESVVESAEIEDCVICIEPPSVGDTIRLLSCCRHTYHKMCIDQWLTREQICPLCRKSI